VRAVFISFETPGDVDILPDDPAKMKQLLLEGLIDYNVGVALTQDELRCVNLLLTEN